MAQTVSRVRVGVHQLEATVFGSGGPVVVIEPGFGGSRVPRLEPPSLPRVNQSFARFDSDR
jgi:hypothetical protein